jgi:hypothetical protein
MVKTLPIDPPRIIIDHRTYEPLTLEEFLRWPSDSMYILLFVNDVWWKPVGWLL